MGDGISVTRLRRTIDIKIDWEREKDDQGKCEKSGKKAREKRKKKRE